jgi:hypothetical protein
MDLEAASAFFRVIVENHSHYSVAIQRTLLEGIFQLADECQENLRERADAQQCADLQTSLELTKLFANEALKNGNLCEGFRLASESFWPSPVLPEDYG